MTAAEPPRSGREQPLNVAVLDADVSYPPTSGKRLRTLGLLLPLAGRHRITYLARGSGDAGANRAAGEFLRRHGIDCRIADDPVARKKGPGFYARLAVNLLSPEPYSVATHRSARLAALAAEHAAAHPVDLWQVEFSGHLSLLPAGHPAPVVLQAPNVDTLIWQRYRETERNPLKRWYITRQWRKFDAFERKAFRRATRVVACTDDDAAILRGEMGLDNVRVVDNGFDRAFFEGVAPAADARAVLFLGSLDWRPNLDAVRLLLDEILPRVRREIPDALAWVVGRSPPAWLRQRIAETPGVELHADVPDVRPFLAGSAVQAVPLRIGGGSRLKILEALACALPVVSTRVGAEGLHLEPGVDFVRADTPEEMAAALVRSLREPDWARGMARQGQRVVLGRYTWGSLADRLDAVWRECAGGGGA